MPDVRFIEIMHLESPISILISETAESPTQYNMQFFKIKHNMKSYCPHDQLCHAVKLFFAAAILCLTINTSKAQCPVMGDLTGMTGIYQACPGNTQSYSVTPVSGAISYTWTLPPGATISGQNPFTTTLTTVTVDFGTAFNPPGNICVIASNGCSFKGPLCKTITGTGAPSSASAISGPFSACPGNVLNYSVASIPNRTYNWTAPAGAVISSGQGTNSVNVTFNAGFTAQGDLCVTVNNGCASSLPRCMTIIRNIPPTPGPVSGPVVVCGGQSVVYTVPSHPSVTNYVWTAPAGCTITGQGTTQVTITFPAGYIYGNVNVQYANGCVISTVRSLAVRSVPATPLPVAGMHAGLCNGSTSYSIPYVPGTTSYTWSITGGASITAGQGSDTVTASFPLNYNTGKICVYASNICGSGTPRCLNLKREIEILTEPTNQQSCENSSSVFSVAAMGLNLNYQWRKNGTALINGANISGATSPVLSITSLTSADNGNYDVLITNSCSPNKTSSLANLTVNTRPQTPAAIAGGTSVTCPGTNNVIYSIPSQPDAYSYQWSVTNGASIASGQGSNLITVNFGNTNNSGYYISVKAVNQCGISIDSSSVWTRYSVSTPSFVQGPVKVCQGQTGVDYSVQNVAGAITYSWLAPAGASIASGQGTNSVTVNFSQAFNGGTLSVTASNQCYTTAPKNLPIALDIPATPASITGSSYSACNTTLNHSVPAVNGAVSYTWSIPVGATIMNGAGTNSVDIAYTSIPAGSQLCVSANSSCNSSTPRCMVIKSVPVTPPSITSNTAVICRNQTGVIFTAPALSGPSTMYNWIVPSGSTIVSGQNTNSINVTMGVTNGNVGVTAVNACGSSGTRTYLVSMNCRLAENNNADNSKPIAGHNVTVFPNPAQSISTITFDSESESQYAIELVDMLGNIVYKEGGISKPGINKHEINLRQLPKGVYLVALKQINTVRHLKLQVK